ncbi:MAG: pyruvate formate lyase family protein [Bacillota bacterium]
MNLEKLKAIGEWAAYGFYEGENLPHPRKYGLAYRRLYENMDVHIDDDILLAPCEPYYKCLNRIDDGVWTAVNSILNHDHGNGLSVRYEVVSKKKTEFPEYADFIDDLCVDLATKTKWRSQYIHSNPDIYSIVNEGFQPIKDAVEKEGEDQLFLTLKDYIAGIDVYFERVKERLAEKIVTTHGERKSQLQCIHDEFSNCFYTPATSFIQGLLAINFIWMLDGCDSIGRIDYALGHLFESDIISGKLEINFARKLLDDFYFLFEKMHGWNLQLGGYKPDGEDCCNLLTKECLLASARYKRPKPNLAFRINKKTKKEYIDLAMETLAIGSGIPALYNDDLYIQLLMENFKEMPYEDAVMYGFGGCTETMITGMSCVDSLAGSINLAYILGLAMFDGFDILKNEQTGLHTGKFEDFETFEDFYSALKKQIDSRTEGYVNWVNKEIEFRLTNGDPKIARTLFTKDCIKNRKSFEGGGARYNWAVTSYDGSSVLIDSLYAIKKAVFDNNLISKKTLVEALKCDFVGYETEREILKSQSTFGNDIESVDLLGADILEHSWLQLLNYKTPRGGKHVPSIILFTTYENSGAPVCATANGRSSGTYLNDSVGACQGVDVNGPTALINSVLRLPNKLAFGTPVFNMRIQKSLLSQKNGQDKYWSLIENFFIRGGLQIQVSVLDKEELLAAQAEPDKHKDIIVRMGGYSEYFLNLSKGLQDSVIKRSEQI